MSEPPPQLARLEQIAASLESKPDALALIGLGSVGRELERLDQFSDLDFFVIVAPGSKEDYLDDLSWLVAAYPLAYLFRNTPDGYKALFADNIFCEFAVFEVAELSGVPFTPGRVVWKRGGLPDTIAEPQQPPTGKAAPNQDWLLGEALTNLYVGLCRFRRGEKLSAMRFIQGYAVDRVVELVAIITQPKPVALDQFIPERRFELRYPQYAGFLGQFLQGYERSPQSALAILTFLQENFDVNPDMAGLIVELGEI